MVVPGPLLDCVENPWAIWIKHGVNTPFQEDGTSSGYGSKSIGKNWEHSPVVVVGICILM